MESQRPVVRRRAEQRETSELGLGGFHTAICVFAESICERGSCPPPRTVPLKSVHPTFRPLLWMKPSWVEGPPQHCRLDVAEKLSAGSVHTCTLHGLAQTCTQRCTRLNTPTHTPVHARSVVPNCDTGDCTPPGSSTHGILQPRILERAALSSSRGSSQPRDQTGIPYVSCTGRGVLYR